jgi:AcrR family transcriptional regulator
VKRSEAKTDLRHDAICSAALLVADRDGLAGLTIRRVAQEVGVAPMTIYGVVASKEELIGLIAERALNELRLPQPAVSWEASLLLIMNELRRLMLKHPSLPQIFSIRRVSLSAIGFATFIDAVLQELEHGGVRGEEAVSGFFNLLTFVLGYVLFELPRRDPVRATPKPGAAIAGFDEVKRLAKHHSLTYLGRYAPEITNLERGESFEDGVRALLQGLAGHR